MDRIELLPEQKRASRECQAKLKKLGMVILAGEMRSGKTLSFIDAAAAQDRKIMIITKKGAIDGIKEAVESYGFPDRFIVTNYHGTMKIKPSDDVGVVVIDEFHNYIQGYPKRGPIWKSVREHTKRKPVLFSSGTPSPEGYAGLFNSLALSDRSPWRGYKKFTDWHKDYGYPYTIRINGIAVDKWDRVDGNRIKREIEPYIVTLTRSQTGHKFDAKDKLHHIDLGRRQDRFYKVLEDDGLYPLPGDWSILADTPAKLVQKLHQISGGFVNAVYDYDETQKKIYSFNRIPKIKYIQDNFDPDKTVILAYFRSEQDQLSRLFPHVDSVTKRSDGVDYSHFDDMVIYSMSHSAKIYEQVRARQLNFKKRTKPVTVHFLLSGIDEEIYHAVAVEKRDFTASWYNRR